MFGLGFFEIMAVILIAFLVFGPRQFPIIAKNFIKALNEFRKVFLKIEEDLNQVKSEVQNQLHQVTDIDHKKSSSLNLEVDKNFKTKNKKDLK